LIESLNIRTTRTQVGELGGVSLDAISAVLMRAKENSNMAGVMVWSLRGHRDQGGFYQHHEWDDYWSYHFPGVCVCVCVCVCV
jgi:hypothetical protein